MNTSDIFFVVIGIVFVLGGLASIVTGKVYLMGKSAAKYTDESLKKFARPYGVMNMLVGVSFIAEQLMTNEIQIGDFKVQAGIVVMVAVLIAVVALYVVCKKILVKK